MSLEDTFNQAVEEWKPHCLNTAHLATREPCLDCDSYKQLVSMGSKALPLIRNQLNKEYELEIEYEAKLKKIKIRLFGTEEVDLFGDNYKKVRKDEEFQQYTEGYHEDVIGNPGFRWNFVLREIIPSFNIESESEKGRKATIKWLDDNMNKYMQEE